MWWKIFLAGMIGFLISGKVFRVWVAYIVGIGKSAWIYASCSVGMVMNIGITSTCQTVTQCLELLVVATLVTQGLA